MGKSMDRGARKQKREKRAAKRLAKSMAAFEDARRSADIRTILARAEELRNGAFKYGSITSTTPKPVSVFDRGI